jgi:hypothetical protein
MDGQRQITGRSERTGPTALTDPSLDRGIESLLAVEPTPKFLARVRTRVAQEPGPRTWRTSWMFAAAGAMAVVIVTILVWQSNEPESSVDAPSPTPQVAEAIAPVTPPSSPVRKTVSRPAIARTVAIATARDHSIDIDLREVVIAENEVRTFASLVASIRQSRFDVSVPAAPDLDAPIEIKELPPVEPIEIEPIVKLAALEAEGERP